MFRFVKGEFANDSISTVGMEFSTRSLPFERCNLNAQIWDLAGQARGSKMTSHYFKDAVGAILIYDLTSVESFNNIKTLWMPPIREFGHPNINIILIGNKVDMEGRKVSAASAIELVQEFNICGYIEVSALTGLNVENAFRRIIYTVGSLLPAVKVHLDVLGLPVGWMIHERNTSNENYNKTVRESDISTRSVNSASNKNPMALSPRSSSAVGPPPASIVSYMNYWTGEISLERPILAAPDKLVYVNNNIKLPTLQKELSSQVNNATPLTSSYESLHPPSNTSSSNNKNKNINLEIKS